MFLCRRCGNCCRWPGAVKLREGEADAIAAYLQMPLEQFLDRHTRLTPDRQYLSLLEKDSGECEYLQADEAGLALCSIEAVKPQQCRDFPEKWNFPNWREKCAGGAAEQRKNPSKR